MHQVTESNNNKLPPIAESNKLPPIAKSNKIKPTLEQDYIPQPNNNQLNLVLEQEQIVDQNKNKQNKTHQEEHIQAGQYIKSSVYGGLDGVVNSLTVILGGIASGTNPVHILAIGVSVMIGDGLGMGLGDYLSAKSEKQFIKSEELRQLWEVDNKLQDQKDEIRQIYTKKGYKPDQVERICQLYATNKQAFVNIMMLQQLGLVVDDSNPLYGGIVTFFAFALFSLLPLIPYIIGAGIIKDKQSQYGWIAILIGGVELFSLGFAKAMITGLNKIFSGLQSLLLGASAIAIGYGIGYAFL